MKTGEVDGWTRHFACCEPVSGDGKLPYCDDHWPFVEPETVGGRYVRSLRKFMK